jgi:hypothetical protein
MTRSLQIASALAFSFCIFSAPLTATSAQAGVLNAVKTGAKVTAIFGKAGVKQIGGGVKTGLKAGIGGTKLIVGGAALGAKVVAKGIKDAL